MEKSPTLARAEKRKKKYSFGLYWDDKSREVKECIRGLICVCEGKMEF